MAMVRVSTSGASGRARSGGLRQLVDEAAARTPAPMTPDVVAQADEPRAALMTLAVISIAGVGFLAWILDRIYPDSAYAQTAAQPVIEGVTIFAVFFVAAQALERLLEPLSKLILPKERKEEEKEEKERELEEKVTALTEAEVSTGGSNPESSSARTQAQEAAQGLATAKANLDARQKERVIFFWALGTGLAIWASASMHLYFLKTVGIGRAPRWAEILATGLIIGAGTKPLHDLVKAIQAKSEATQSQASKEEQTA